MGIQDLSQLLSTRICVYRGVSVFAVRGTEAEPREVGTETVFFAVQPRPQPAAARSPACLKMSLFLRKRPSLYEYTAERSDLPISPSLSKLSTLQRRCYYTP